MTSLEPTLAGILPPDAPTVAVVDLQLPATSLGHREVASFSLAEVSASPGKRHAAAVVRCGKNVSVYEVAAKAASLVGEDGFIALLSRSKASGLRALLGRASGPVVSLRHHPLHDLCAALLEQGARAIHVSRLSEPSGFVAVHGRIVPIVIERPEARSPKSDPAWLGMQPTEERD